MATKRVVIIGSGFGGLFAAKGLRRSDVDVTLISKTPNHLFQPLLYQVATGILSEGSIAPATRDILKRQSNARVETGLVTGIDTVNRILTQRFHDEEKQTPYDRLIVAAGAGQSYFGHDEFETFAPGMKTIDDALELRGRILGAFEQAERSSDPERRKKLLTFVVVGAGPTGVEMEALTGVQISLLTIYDMCKSVDKTMEIYEVCLCSKSGGKSGDVVYRTADGE